MKEQSDNPDIDNIKIDAELEELSNEDEQEEGEEVPEENEDEDEDEFVNEDKVKEIEEKEQELLDAKKQWQMTGEVLAHERPIDSLVGEILDFQLATKMPLVHTVIN